MANFPIPSNSRPTTSLGGGGRGFGGIPSPRADPVGSWVGRPTTTSAVPSIGGTVLKGLSLGLLIVQGSFLALDLIGRAGANRWRDNLLKQINGGNSSQVSEEVVDTNVRIYLLRNDGVKVVVFRDDDPSFPGLGALRVSDIPNVRFYANDQEAINNGWFFVFRGEAVVRPYFIPPVRYEDAQGNQLPSDLKTEQRGEPATNPFVVPQIPSQPQPEIVPSPTPTQEPTRQPVSFPSPVISPRVNPIKQPRPQPLINPNPSPTPQPQPQTRPNPQPTPFPNILTFPVPVPLPIPRPIPQSRPQPITTVIQQQREEIIRTIREITTIEQIRTIETIRQSEKCCPESNTSQTPQLVTIAVQVFKQCNCGVPCFDSINISVPRGSQSYIFALFFRLAQLEALQCQDSDCDLEVFGAVDVESTQLLSIPAAAVNVLVSFSDLPDSLGKRFQPSALNIGLIGGASGQSLDKYILDALGTLSFGFKGVNSGDSKTYWTDDFRLEYVNQIIPIPETIKNSDRFLYVWAEYDNTCRVAFMRYKQAEACE